MKLALVATAVLLAVMPGHAQAPSQGPAFEIAAIHRSDSLAAGGTIAVRPGGRWVADNIPVRSLIATAWGVPGNRVFGGPEWATTDRYNIEAIVGRDDPSPGDTQLMVQRLLRDRFSVVVRREQRELPVYLLLLASPDGRLGPRMQSSDVDCLDPVARKQAQAAAAARDRIACGINFGTGRYRVGGSAASVLEGLLSGATGRPVLDRTGLTGRYDFELEWTATLDADARPADSVSIFTAVQEQLGMKLEPSTAPLDVLVIERIARPTEN